MDKVVISPPYSIENINPRDGKDEKALSYIKGIVSLEVIFPILYENK